jgi:hypothetical protein
MRIGRGNRSTGRKTVPAPLYPSQSHMTWPRIELEPSRCEPATNRLRYGTPCHFNLFFFSVSLGAVRLSPLGTSATVGLLYKPRMIDDDYGAIGGMRIGRGNRSTRRKLAPVPLCPPQIPHDLTWDRTRTYAVGSQRLTAWAMARPCHFNFLLLSDFSQFSVGNKTVHWVTFQTNPCSEGKT